MQMTLILASKSETRAKLLTNANVDFVCKKPNIDEENLKMLFLLNGTDVSKISGKLAESKAKKINLENPNAFVIGCDQTLIFKKNYYQKLKRSPMQSIAYISLIIVNITYIHQQLFILKIIQYGKLQIKQS